MMSLKRFNIIMSGMRGTATKVYEAVPKGEAWTVPQILSELKRGNVNMELKDCRRWLGNLASAGVINEIQSGYFKQEPIRAPSAKELCEETIPMVKAIVSVNPPANQAGSDPLEVLGKLAQRAALLAAEAKAIADGVNDAVVEVMERIEADQKTLEKARQLKSLLSEI
jgi:hypothetical protein